MNSIKIAFMDNSTNSIDNIEIDLSQNLERRESVARFFGTIENMAMQKIAEEAIEENPDFDIDELDITPFMIIDGDCYNIAVDSLEGWR